MYVPMFASAGDSGTPPVSAYPRRSADMTPAQQHVKLPIYTPNSRGGKMAMTPETMASPAAAPQMLEPMGQMVGRSFSTEAPKTPPVSYVAGGGGQTSSYAPVYQSVYTPRDVITQQHAWTAGNRSITPPPAVVTPPVVSSTACDAPGSDEWVSISTVNMSPFTILRIKALIELSGITDDYQYAVRTTGGSPSPAKAAGASRLRSKINTPVEFPDGHVPPQWWIAQLNDLIVSNPPSDRRESLARVNMQLQAEKYQLKIDEDYRKSSKLTFNPGAALICFDPKEKPRRIKDNHRKHFQEFLLQQQQQQAVDFFRTD